MLLLEIGLAITAFRKGWRWRVLLPVGISFAAAFLIGVGAGAAGGSAENVTPLLMLLDIGLIVVLAVMTGRAPVARVPSSATPAMPPATEAEAVHVFGQDAV